MGAAVLLIEDDQDVAHFVTDALRTALPNVEVRCATTLSDGMGALSESQIDCVVLDYRLPDGSGLDALRTMRSRYPVLPVIMLTGAGSEEVAVEAMKLGASDYLVKQGRFVDAVPRTVRVALGRLAIADAQTVRADAMIDVLEPRTREYCRTVGLIGSHAAFTETLRTAESAARSAAPVLLEGESGTGKERIARLIHDLSARNRALFLPVNCAALPEHLIESELFGHVRGAFSGADRDHRGLFECATGGTLFLDEVGELPLAMQPKLLRALQEHEVRPVGAVRARQVDVRIIAAWNRDLRLAVSTGQFRKDLFHRLHVLPIRVPPLRERRSDVPLLAASVLARLSDREHRPAPVLTRDAWLLLEQCPWSGNVRELENELHRLVVSVDPGTPIDVRHFDHLGQARAGSWPAVERPLKEIVEDVEVAAVTDRLRRFGYSRTAAAKSLGLTREGLWQKLRRLRLDMPRSRA